MTHQLPSSGLRRRKIVLLCPALLLHACGSADASAHAAVTATPVASAPAECAAVKTASGALTKTVLIDRTTHLEMRDREALGQQLVDRWQREGGRFIVATTGGRISALYRTLFDAALPPGDDATSRWTQTPNDRKRAIACQAALLARLREALGHALGDVDGSHEAVSPVIEALAALFPGNAGPGPGRLVYVSDGIEHTQGLSFYAGQDRVRALNPTAIVEALKRQGALPRLNGVSVEHVGIGQPAPPREGGRPKLRPPAEMRSLEATWTAIYSAAGASSVSFGHPLLPPVRKTLQSGAP